MILSILPVYAKLDLVNYPMDHVSRFVETESELMTLVMMAILSMGMVVQVNAKFKITISVLALSMRYLSVNIMAILIFTYYISQRQNTIMWDR